MSQSIVKINDVCEFVRGLTYSKSDEVEHSNNAVLRATNIDLNSNRLNLSEIRYIADSVNVKADKKVRVNDILICTASGSKSHLGKVALIEEKIDMAFGGFMGVLRAKPNINPKYLFAFFKSEIFLKHVFNTGDGANINNLKFSQFEDLEIVLPTLPIQQKVVAKLDAIFAEIDKATAAAEANAKNAEELLISYISQSFNALKNDCEYIKLGDVCSSVGYGSSSKSEPIGKVPVLRMGNIVNGKLDFSDLVFTNSDDEIKKYQLRNGDVLFNRTNSPLHVGKSAVFISDEPTIFAGYLIRINFDRKKVVPEYLTYYLNSAEIRKYGYSVMSHSINQANINGSKLKDYPFLCPSFEIQKKIVDAINLLKIQSEFLVENYTNKIKKLNLYKQSILKQAFNGELVKE